MVGLLDIAPAAETVTVRGQALAVQGVSARGVAVLLGRFPELRALLAQQHQDITPERLVAMIPDAIAAIIAAGTGSPGDAGAEAVADGLPIDDQVNLLEAILRLTLPKGIGPFVERLAGLGGRLGVALPAPGTPATTSPEPSKA